jgi:plasmid stabilization system protein ParE
MSYIISIHNKAESEYEDAYNWYSLQKEGLAELFFAAVNNKIQQIVSAPESYSVKNSNCREAIVEGFPYVIVYRIKKRLRVIHVIAIHHTSRKPKKKYNR